MFERRLYYHIDWALLARDRSRCARIGVAMIYSTTGDPTRGDSRIYVTQIYAIVLGLGAMVVCLTLDYRTLHRQVALHLPRPAGAAHLRAVLRRRADGRAALDFARAASTFSRRSSPRSASRWCSRSSSARTAARRRGATCAIGGVLTAAFRSR